jgi:hypothetical protein
MRFEVEITETLQKTVEVEADDEGEALRIVHKMYRDEEIVLCEDSFIGFDMEVLQSKD